MNYSLHSLGIIKDLDNEELRMLEDSLKDLPPIKKKRIMKKVDVASYFIQRPLLGR